MVTCVNIVSLMPCASRTKCCTHSIQRAYSGFNIAATLAPFICKYYCICMSLVSLQLHVIQSPYSLIQLIRQSLQPHVFVPPLYWHRDGVCTRLLDDRLVACISVVPGFMNSTYCIVSIPLRIHQILHLHISHYSLHPQYPSHL